MTSGIYKIYFRDTPHKVYIGSSKHCEERRKQHLYDLKRGVHINPLLQYAFNKHLEETLVFEVIEEVELKMLIPQERYWYAKSLDDGLEVYNVIIPDNHPINNGKTRFKKGMVPWNKGVKTAKPKEPYSRERHLKKLSESHKGQKAWNKNTNIQSNTGRTHFKKGNIPEWLKNKTPENLEKKRLASIKCSETKKKQNRKMTDVEKKKLSIKMKEVLKEKKLLANLKII